MTPESYLYVYPQTVFPYHFLYPAFFKKMAERYVQRQGFPKEDVQQLKLF